MRFVGPKSRGNFDSPMLNQGANVEGCGHGSKGALHLFLSQHIARIVI